MASRQVVTAAALVALIPAAARPADSPDWCGTRVDGAALSLAAHREERLRRGGVRSAAAAAGLDFDAGDVAVLVDAGDLVLAQALFDLSGAGLRLVPVGTGWSVARVDAAALPDVGEPLPLGDDDTRSVELPFAFPFFGAAYTTAFVNSDGNITFGAGDGASTARDLGRLLGGPPRIAPLLADLNPEAGGQVSASATAEGLVVTWSGVPQFDRFGSNSFQVVLRPDGSVELSWGAVVATIQEGVVGLSPGTGVSEFTPLDLSGIGVASVSGAFAESFRDAASLDVVATARRFYATHPDEFDQLLVFTDQQLVSGGTFAFQQTIRNSIRGIGLGQTDHTAGYGSAGRLESLAMMDDIGKYPADPAVAFLGEDSSLGVLAHEVGHRWLARVQFRDGDRNSEELLGRQSAHWSFYADTDGSHLEGNDIQDLGDGSFRTAGASQRYSALDLYLMGLLAPEAVPPFFFVREVTGGGAVDPTRTPRTGVLFSGLRVDVSVDDVIGAVGARTPAPGPPQAPWRQAFLYVTSTAAPNTLEVEKVQRFRDAWEPFFAAATAGLWSADSRLR
jgi:hypothetical protein